MAASATTQDIQDLIRFVQRTEDVFNLIVVSRHILFREQTRQLIESAWPDVDAEIKDVLKELDSASPQLQDNLGKVGLSGSQLELKIAGFDRVLERFTKRGTLKLLNKLLTWINNILGTLLSAVPSAEAIKEFKDVIEAELNDDDPI